MSTSSFDPARFTARRKSQGLTQRALALKAGVSQALVAEIERGKHPPSTASLAKLAAALSAKDSDFASEAR